MSLGAGHKHDKKLRNAIKWEQRPGRTAVHDAVHFMTLTRGSAASLPHPSAC